ncbi:MAG: metallopeptidase family protein [Patescibacteria group bacterium]
MEREQFVQLVTEAVQAVPEPLREKIENVVFVVEEDSRPPKFRERGIVIRSFLLGLYQGVPLTKRGINYSLVPPDKITIFHKPIEELGGPTDAGIRALVHDVVHHELAHYFGFDEPAVRKMEQSRKRKKST